MSKTVLHYYCICIVIQCLKTWKRMNTFKGAVYSAVCLRVFTNSYEISYVLFTLCCALKIKKLKRVYSERYWWCGDVDRKTCSSCRKMVHSWSTNPGPGRNLHRSTPRPTSAQAQSSTWRGWIQMDTIVLTLYSRKLDWTEIIIDIKVLNFS